MLAPQIANIYKVLALPGTIEALLPWLEDGDVCAQLYALWRLETVLCGGSKTFSRPDIGQSDSAAAQHASQNVGRARG